MALSWSKDAHNDYYNEIMTSFYRVIKSLQNACMHGHRAMLHAVDSTTDD